MRKLHFVWLISCVIFWSLPPAQAQNHEAREIPPEQLPIEERDQGDSFIENAGELPGDIVALPATLLFKGASHVARVVDYNAIVLHVNDFLTSEDEKRKVRLTFTPFSGGGVLFRQDDLFTSGLNFRANASMGARTRREFYAGLNGGSVFARGFGFNIAGHSLRLPDEDFFGIGNQSGKLSETNYLFKENRGEFGLVAAVRAAKIAAGLSISDVQIGEGRDPNKPTLDSLFNETEVPGFSGAKMAGIFLKYYHDTRNQSGHPTSGGEALVAFELANELDGEQFAYKKVTVDLRRYIDLFYHRVLALQIRAERTDAVEGKKTPFYRLAGLGGLDNLRGYRPVRFRDRDLLLATAEYRWVIHGQAIAYGFFQEGRVFDDMLDNFSLDGFKYSYGGGLRLRARDGGLIAVFELARSAEQLRFTFGLNTELRKF